MPSRIDEMDTAKVSTKLIEILLHYLEDPTGYQIEVARWDDYHSLILKINKHNVALRNVYTFQIVFVWSQIHDLGSGDDDHVAVCKKIEDLVRRIKEEAR